MGTPITVEVKGIGWRPLESSWMLLYDNNFTGWISAVTTAGSAKFTIPASGRPGLHLLEVLHGEFTFPYRNMQQSPEGERPRFALRFNLTPGAPVLPPPIEEQAQQSVQRLPALGALAMAPPFAGVGQPVMVSGAGFAPGKRYALEWTTVIGNRVVAKRSGEDATFRVYTEDSGRRLLKPLNLQYPVMEMDDNFHICGVVISHWMDD